jgi:hypothetical protein
LTRVRATALCDHCGQPSPVATTTATRICFTCSRPWDAEAADRFIDRARSMFPGSVEIDRRGNRIPPEQPRLF